MNLSNRILTISVNIIFASNLSGQSYKPVIHPITQQETEQTQIRELAIGEKVPDFEFELVNYPSKMAKLSDFKDKYIVLDFWATWCTSCLNHFPEMDSLQKQFNGKLQVLLVNTKDTRDDKKKIAAFFDKRKTSRGEKYQLPSIVIDTITNVLFPHKLIPHYVLIDNRRIVRAITSSDQITEKNIELFINDEKLSLLMKKDLDYDYQKPLFINGNGGNNENYIYRSILTGYLEGLSGSSTITFNDDRRVIKLCSINASILSLFERAYNTMGKFPKNRVILNVKKPENYSKDNNSETWNNNMLYGYELITPPISIEKARKMMQDDLKRFFDVNVYYEKRKVKSLVLKSIKKGEKIFSKYGPSETNIYDKNGLPKYIHNYPISTLVNYLNDNLATPVIDETHFLEYINIELPSDLTNIKLLKEALRICGFNLSEEERELEFFVLEERDF